MPARFDTEVFYETHLEPDAVFRTETVTIRKVDQHDVKTVTSALNFEGQRFSIGIPFYDLDPISVVYRTYEPTVAGAVLWLKDQAVATLGMLDRGHPDGIHHFHQILKNLAKREKDPPRVLPKARLPKCRPALFAVGMQGQTVDKSLDLHRFTRALMVAFLQEHQRAWHARETNERA